ncbi:hypothetical protein NL676_022338 [Syzygium grande]|nr:hypothetical protein NL676_022338 [Syzygium grande]
MDVAMEFGSDQFGSNRTEINTLPLAETILIPRGPPHSSSRRRPCSSSSSPSTRRPAAAAAAAAAAAVAGDDTHLSRTLNAENPPNHQTPRGGPGTPPPPHHPHSNSKPQGSEPPALESVELASAGVSSATGALLATAGVEPREL